MVGTILVTGAQNRNVKYFGGHYDQTNFNSKKFGQHNDDNDTIVLFGSNENHTIDPGKAHGTGQATVAGPAGNPNTTGTFAFGITTQIYKNNLNAGNWFGGSGVANFNQSFGGRWIQAELDILKLAVADGAKVVIPSYNKNGHYQANMPGIRSNPVFGAGKNAVGQHVQQEITNLGNVPNSSGADGKDAVKSLKEFVALRAQIAQYQGGFEAVLDIIEKGRGNHSLDDFNKDLQTKLQALQQDPNAKKIGQKNSPQQANQEQNDQPQPANQSENQQGDYFSRYISDDDLNSIEGFPALRESLKELQDKSKKHSGTNVTLGKSDSGILCYTAEGSLGFMELNTALSDVAAMDSFDGSVSSCLVKVNKFPGRENPQYAIAIGSDQGSGLVFVSDETVDKFKAEQEKMNKLHIFANIHEDDAFEKEITAITSGFEKKEQQEIVEALENSADNNDFFMQLPFRIKLKIYDKLESKLEGIEAKNFDRELVARCSSEDFVLYLNERSSETLTDIQLGRDQLHGVENDELLDAPIPKNTFDGGVAFWNSRGPANEKIVSLSFGENKDIDIAYVYLEGTPNCYVKVTNSLDENGVRTPKIESGVYHLDTNGKYNKMEFSAEEGMTKASLDAEFDYLQMDKNSEEISKKQQGVSDSIVEAYKNLRIKAVSIEKDGKHKAAFLEGDKDFEKTCDKLKEQADRVSDEESVGYEEGDDISEVDPDDIEQDPELAGLKAGLAQGGVKSGGPDGPPYHNANNGHTPLSL